MSSRTSFFTAQDSLTFIQWRKAFIKAPILYYFDSKHYIQIETDVSGYAISLIVSQLPTKKSLVG